MELDDNLKKNPKVAELFGKYKKISEEIDLVSIELLGKTGNKEIDEKLSLKSEKVDLVTKWNNEVNKAGFYKQIWAIQIGNIIINDKIRDLMRLNMELKETSIQLLGVVGTLKPEEKEVKKEVEYKLTEEEKKEVKADTEKYIKAHTDGKKAYVIKRGECGAIVRDNKDNPELMNRMLYKKEVAYRGYEAHLKLLEKKKKTSKKDVKQKIKKVKEKKETPKQK